MCQWASEMTITKSTKDTNITCQNKSRALLTLWGSISGQKPSIRKMWLAWEFYFTLPGTGSLFQKSLMLRLVGNLNQNSFFLALFNVRFLLEENAIWARATTFLTLFVLRIWCFWLRNKRRESLICWVFSNTSRGYCLKRYMTCHTFVIHSRYCQILSVFFIIDMYIDITFKELSLTGL